MEEFGGNEFLKLKYNQIKVLMLDQIKQVYLAQKKDNQEKKIIKEINLLKLNEKERDMAIQEGIILSKLKHPNIINCNEFHLENDKIDIIMEYAEGGDLFNKIKEQKNKNKIFEEKEIIEWFIEICEGVKYIHENKIIHRDLKPLNIFLTKNNKIKIGDFGIAALLKYRSQAETVIGTQIYLSPEIMKSKLYNYKSDIWNLGIILYELTQLKHPFFDENISNEKMINNIEKENINFINMNYSERLLNLIKNILKVNPNERLDINKIILECHTIIIKKNSNSNNE